MSKITLTPNASGTGTFTVASPNSNTNRTLTLPDEAGELLINGTTSNVGIGTSSPTTKLQSKGGSISTPTNNAGLIANASASFVVEHGNDYGIYTGYVNSTNDAVGIAATRTLGGALPLSLQPFGGNVGIGTSSPSALLDVQGSSGIIGRLQSSSGDLQVNMVTPNANDAIIAFGDASTYRASIAVNTSDAITFQTGSSLTERMRIDSSGNLLVGKTATDSGTVGFEAAQDGHVFVTVNNTLPFYINRQSGSELQRFASNGTTVGIIGTTTADLWLGTGISGLYFYDSASSVIPWNAGSNTTSDNVLDLGYSAYRWQDIYATNGTIQTSDRNEKQDIEALSDAEQRVAVACKGLLRKFRWIDAVAEKGDDARIHFGIIAQDLQDAFAAEGLDAGRYAMFISSTWWETQTEVPAVEAVAAVYEDVVIPAVLDEDGNEVEAERTEQQLVTEAVEAKEAYTRTDTYETLEEAPEGATERTRLGVRYPELLAFIIGAM